MNYYLLVVYLVGTAIQKQNMTDRICLTNISEKYF